MPLKIQTTLPYQEDIDDVLILPFELRQKSRFKARLESGTEVGLFLKRGNILRNGDILQAENGLIIRLNAAVEAVSLIRCADSLQLAKLCYHLGNRHVPLQIETDKISYLEDSVLDAMVLGLGATVIHELRPFEPEHGAYSLSHHQ